VARVVQKIDEVCESGEYSRLREGINIVDASTPVVRCELELLCDV